MNQHHETIQLTVTADAKHQLEVAAASLNLTVSAYLMYLHSRQQSGIDPEALDRIVHEVFGRYGKAMRRLAE